jgi:MFS superfamily sulfate permease-like transporter
MAAARDIPELDRKGLREFGLVTGAIVAGLFGLFFPWVLERAIPIWPWVVLVVLAGLALIAPNSLRPVYYGWMRIGLLLGKVTTPVVMGLIFVVIIVPVALVRRLARRDSLRRKYEPDLPSYRVKSEHPPKGNLERPF